jgi:hypothetical protein
MNLIAIHSMHGWIDCRTIQKTQGKALINSTSIAISVSIGIFVSIVISVSIGTCV